MSTCTEIAFLPERLRVETNDILYVTMAMDTQAKLLEKLLNQQINEDVLLTIHPQSGKVEDFRVMGGTVYNVGRNGREVLILIG